MSLICTGPAHDLALIKKVHYTFGLIPLSDFSAEFHGLASNKKRIVYLCPTMSERNCFLCWTHLTKYKSKIIPWVKLTDSSVVLGTNVKLTDGQYLIGAPAVNKYKMPVCDTSYDWLRRAYIAIVDNATCNLHVIHSTQDGAVLGAPQVIQLGNEADAANAKLIFEQNSHKFYLKFMDKIYLCDSDNLNLNNLIDEKQIKDAWAKEYLEDPKPMTHSCAKMAYASVSGVSYFNTSCLHALEFEQARRKNLETDLARRYSERFLDITQCACDPGHNTHYYLTKGANNRYSDIYNLTNVRFEPEARMQAMLDFMNTSLEPLRGTGQAATQLHANALYIYYAYTNDWALTPEQLSTKIGILNQLVSQRLKDIIFPLPSAVIPSQSWFKRTIAQYTQPYMGYIKKTTGALSLGAIGIALFSKLSEKYRSSLAAIVATGTLSYWLRPQLFTRSNPQ